MSLATYADFGRLYLWSKTGLDRLCPSRPHPLRSSVRLTERCNSRCVTCGYWKKKWQDKISFDQAVQLVRDLKAVGVERLRFTGGEPLVRTDFMDVLKTIKPGDFSKLTIATNGLLLGKYAPTLTKTPVTDLGVSLDGLEATNDELRGVPGYFAKAVAGIRATDKRVTVMTTVHTRNVDELEGLFEPVSYTHLRAHET